MIIAVGRRFFSSGGGFRRLRFICLGGSFPLPNTVRSDRAAMNTVIRALGPLIAMALAGSTLLAETAPTSHSNRTAPISAELAKRCRAGSVQNLSHFRLAERHPALAHAVMAPLICWSFSNSMFRYLLVDHAVPAMWRSLAAARLSAD